MTNEDFIKIGIVATREFPAISAKTEIEFASWGYPFHRVVREDELEACFVYDMVPLDAWTDSIGKTFRVGFSERLNILVVSLNE